MYSESGHLRGSRSRKESILKATKTSKRNFLTSKDPFLTPNRFNDQIHGVDQSHNISRRMTTREWKLDLSDDESDGEEENSTTGDSNSKKKVSDLAKKLNDENSIVAEDEMEDDDDFNPMDQSGL